MEDIANFYTEPGEYVNIDLNDDIDAPITNIDDDTVQPINMQYGLAKFIWPDGVVDKLYHNDTWIWPPKPTGYDNGTMQIENFLRIYGLEPNWTISVGGNDTEWPTLFAIVNYGKADQTILPLYKGHPITISKGYTSVYLYGYNNDDVTYKSTKKCTARFNRGTLAINGTTYNCDVRRKHKISCDKKYGVAGNILSLAHPDWYIIKDTDTTILRPRVCAFWGLFMNETNLVEAKNLIIDLAASIGKATTSTGSGYACCESMFSGCTNLEEGPVINYGKSNTTGYVPKTALARMFLNCKNLISVTIHVYCNIEDTGSGETRSMYAMFKGTSNQLNVYTLDGNPFYSNTIDFPYTVHWREG